MRADTADRMHGHATHVSPLPAWVKWMQLYFDSLQAGTFPHSHATPEGTERTPTTCRRRHATKYHLPTATAALPLHYTSVDSAPERAVHHWTVLAEGTQRGAIRGLVSATRREGPPPAAPTRIAGVPPVRSAFRVGQLESRRFEEPMLLRAPPFHLTLLRLGLQHLPGHGGADMFLQRVVSYLLSLPSSCGLC